MSGAEETSCLVCPRLAPRDLQALSGEEEEMSKLDEIRKLIEGATPGPWTKCEFAPSIIYPNNYTAFGACSKYSTNADAAFIAASRSLMPKLLAVAEAVAKVKANQFGDMFWQCDAGPLEELDDAFAALEGSEK